MRFVLTFTILTLCLLLCWQNDAVSQTQFVSGRVVDVNGAPLAGAIVRVEASRAGTYTTMQGYFNLKASDGDVIVIKSVGMSTHRLVVQTIVDSLVIVMKYDSTIGSEVVVTALGLTNTKRALGYSTQSISGDDVRSSGRNDILTGLSSRISGLEVINSGGSPGAAVFIRLRGMASINGDNQPLIVIDGIPIDNEQIASSDPTRGVSYSNRALDIDPNTIEDLQVLKGPTAAALYGIRAANGAVLITTKHGRSPADRGVSISANISISNDVPTGLPQVQSVYSQGENGMFSSASSASRSFGAKLDTLFYDGIPSTYDNRGSIVGKSAAPAGALPVRAFNPLDGLLTVGQTRSQSVTLQTADAGSSLAVVLSNLETDGIIPLTSWNRRSITANSRMFFSNNIKVASKVSFTSSGGNRSQQGANPSAIMLAAVRTPPSFDNRNGLSTAQALEPRSAAYMTSDGTQRSYRQGVGVDNPYWSMTQNRFRDVVHRLLGSIELTYTPVADVDILIRSGLDYYLDDRLQTNARYSNIAISGRTFSDVIEVSNATMDLIATWNVKVAENVTMRAVAGTNAMSREQRGHYLQSDGIANTEAPRDPNNYSSTIVGQSSRPKRTFAAYSDVQVDFKNMIFLSITGRNEWSTTLPVFNSSFFYPSASSSLILTELFPDIATSTVPFIKLRASYAQVGNDAPVQTTTSGFITSSYRDSWTSGIRFPFNNTIGFSIENRLCSPELSPERTTSQELGFDVSLFDRQVDLSFTAYSQVSDRQIFTVPISASSGFTTFIANGGTVSNKGFEITLNARMIKTALVQWSTTVNLSYNDNMVDALRLTPQYTLGGFQGASIRVVEGLPYGSIFGFAWQRDSLGNRLINDDTASTSYGYPLREQFERGFDNYNPEWIMGLGNNIQIGPFSVAFQMESRLGVFMWNGTRAVMTQFGTHKQTEDREQTRIFDGVKSSNGKPNDIRVPLGEFWYAYGAGTGFPAYNSEDYIENASWVRLRSASISWEVPKTLLTGTPLQRLNVTFTGTNLWYATDYSGVDPESSLLGATNVQGLDYFNMPSTRTYALAITVGL
ncbi:MAG: SusC/RagA family TonB-linked outer membrane protein [Ignavibacteria bacterium]|nr:SusC/RagA family TonB-linked outer membrane protein [Ignavibacteria bacterium]